MKYDSPRAQDYAGAPPDLRGDRVAMLVVSGALLIAFSIGTVAQTVFVYRPERVEEPMIGELPDLGIRLLANLLAVVTALALAVLARLNELPVIARTLAVAGIALLAALLRYLLQLTFDIYSHAGWQTFNAEVVGAALAIAISLFLGASQAQSRARLRAQERLSARQALRAAAALEALTAEELRVRREVAEGLHGTVQNSLVLAGIQIDALIDRWRDTQDRGRDDEDSRQGIAELTRLKQHLDQVRERDVREMSHLLHPVGVELGVAHAVRLLVQRIPPTIATSVHIADGLASGDPLSVERRVLVVRAAEEAITNALKHGNAGMLRVTLTTERDDAAGELRLVVEDDGGGLSRSRPQWNGLARLAERVDAWNGSVTLTGADSGGARLTLTVPVG